MMPIVQTAVRLAGVSAWGLVATVAAGVVLGRSLLEGKLSLMEALAC